MDITEDRTYHWFTLIRWVVLWTRNDLYLRVKCRVPLLLVLCCITCTELLAQDPVNTDTAAVSMVSTQSDSTILRQDTLKAPADELAPLDIGNDRGIFILSNDRLLQLRILGSIRVAANYTTDNLEDDQTFNPYDIPTVDKLRVPVFFVGVQQTRLGVEVIRRTKRDNDVFIRFEGDFKSENFTFRIRHAYARYRNFIAGQTWSLMNNVEFQPALVSLDGPPGKIGIRTPQLRFSKTFGPDWSASAAIEYSITEFRAPDSIDIEATQAIPNVTARLWYNGKGYTLRVSGILSSISGRVDDSKLTTIMGYGMSYAMRASFKDGRIYHGVTAGKGIAHYSAIFNDRNQDVIFDVEALTIIQLRSISGYIAYQHSILKNFTGSVSFGMAAIDNVDEQSDNAFNYAYSTLFDLFWSPVDGTRIGLEYAFGRRFDIGPSSLIAHRLSALFYYDF